MFERNFLTLTVLVFFSFTFTMESFSLSRRRVLRSKLIEVGNVDIKSSGIIVERNPRNGSYSYDQWKKAFANQLNEFDYFLNDENISGNIPQELQGSLFRNMPARFTRGNRDYGHYLDGDGYITRLSIKNRRVHFLSRFVKTDEYIMESQQEKILFRSTFRTQRELLEIPLIGEAFCFNNAFDLYLKNLANTNVVKWGDQLLALFEAGVPYLLDPQTLDTIGACSIGIPSLKAGIPLRVNPILRISPTIHNALFGSSMTAHPKNDKLRSRFISWTWSAEVGEGGPLDTNPIICIREWDQEQQPMQSRLSGVISAEPVLPSPPLRPPLPSYPTPPCPPAVYHKLTFTSVAPHDFSVTDEFYVFVENRVKGNTLPYVLGSKCPAQCVDIVPDQSMILNLVPRPSCQLRNELAKQRRSDIEETFIYPQAQDVKKVALSPGFTIHSVCAFQNVEISGTALARRPDTLELYTTAWKSQIVAAGEVKGGLLGSWEGAAPIFDSIPITLLYRTVVDYRTGELISHSPVAGMEDTIVEHPHINPLFEGRPVRYMYMSLGSVEGISSPPLGYMRLDLLTGEKQEWFAPLHTYCEEVVVVPKKEMQDRFDQLQLELQRKIQKRSSSGGEVPEGSTNTGEPCPDELNALVSSIQEDAVWILATMFDAPRNRSCVGIFDGGRLGDGPVSTVWLDHPLPHSLHGTFVSTPFGPW